MEAADRLGVIQSFEDGAAFTRSRAKDQLRRKAVEERLAHLDRRSLSSVSRRESLKKFSPFPRTLAEDEKLRANSLRQGAEHSFVGMPPKIGGEEETRVLDDSFAKEESKTPYIDIEKPQFTLETEALLMRTRSGLPSQASNLYTMMTNGASADNRLDREEGLSLTLNTSKTSSLAKLAEEPMWATYSPIMYCPPEIRLSTTCDVIQKMDMKESAEPRVPDSLRKEAQERARTRFHARQLRPPVVSARSSSSGSNVADLKARSLSMWETKRSAEAIIFASNLGEKGIEDAGRRVRYMHHSKR